MPWKTGFWGPGGWQGEREHNLDRSQEARYDRTATMPTLLRQNGFEFFFYANEHLPRIFM